MKTAYSIVALLAAVLPFTADAEELSHTYVEAGISRYTEQVPAWLGADEDYDGGYVRGSVAIGADAYVFGGYTRGSDDTRMPVVGDYEIDAARTQLGLGYGWQVAPSTELVAEASYLQHEWDRYSDGGARVSAGVRTQLLERVEGWAKASYTEGLFGRSRYSAQAGALFELTDRWGISGEVDVEDDANRYSLGVRASF